MNTRTAYPLWSLIVLLAATVWLLIQPQLDANRFASTALHFPPETETAWIVSPSEAKQRLIDGALLIDARDTTQKFKKPAPKGSISLRWQDLSMNGMAEKGLPLSLSSATQQLKKLGLHSNQAIVVLGDWQQGWGEDGRVVWSLRRWGYSRAVVVNGGMEALEKIGIPAVQAADKPVSVVLQDVSGLEVALAEVKAKLSKPGVIFLDVREPREFAGNTPYGESRGGHLPGAKNIWFKDFLAENGSLKTRTQIHQLLEQQGVRPGDEIIVYDSTGVRSGWVTAVLRDMGYPARNYAGSMWQWSEKLFFQYPLVAYR